MRKLISIVFISLFLLNVLGYYGLFFGLQYRNSQKMNDQLDADNYKEAEAITIKVPITIPYATDSRDFVRVSGEFEYNGEYYRLVKQRLTRDTLLIVCVKDNQTKRIHQALASYVKTFTDKPVDSLPGSAKVTTDLIKDYLVQSFCFSNSSEGWESELPKSTSIPVFIPDYSSSIVHPPERA